MNEHDSSQRETADPRRLMGAEESATARAKPGEIVAPEVAKDRTIISNKPPVLMPSLKLGMHPSELGEHLEGERLGHFELGEFIGGGGMGAVFRAVDTMLNRTVAVKVLSTDQAGDEETIRRFKNEAQSAARLDHENIARVYYVGEDRGVHYIVFEHIEGINLRDLVVQHGPLSLSDAISYTLQIAEALGHASERDVVHRDIKPSNVLITPGGRAKLVDMGLARLHQVEHTDNDLTASGVTLGTFDYISPEQARDPRTADVRSDLYSLGCTLYFTLVARPPFPEGTVLQKLLKHQADEAPDPRQFRAETPDELARIIAKLLSKSPAARYQTPGDLIADLTALCERFGIRTSGGSSPALAMAAAAPQRPSLLVRSAPWLVPAALLLVGVALLETLWSRSTEPIVLPEIRRIDSEDIQGQVSGQGVTAPSTELTTAPSADEGATPPSASATPPSATEGDSLGTADSTATTAAPGEPDFTWTGLESRHPLRARLSAVAGEKLRQPQFSAAIGAPAAGFTLTAAAPTRTGEAALDADDLPQRTAASAPRSSKTKSQQMGVLVVAPDAPEAAYATLRAACSAAESGDVIELRYDGPLVEKPILLVNRRLTIRAGEGFQPQVVFQPGTDAVDPVEYPRSMFTLAGGELTLINLAIEFDIPRSVAADRWALIETRGSQSVSIRHCVLTIRNAADGQSEYHPNVVFFELAASPGSDGMMPPDPEDEVEPVRLRIQDTIARGEAVFVRSEQMQSLDLAWENGLLVTSRRFAAFHSSPAGALTRATMQLNLQHLTAFVRRGLLLVGNSEDAPQMIDVAIKCADSILMADPSATLVTHEGIDREETFQDRLTWSGDRNFYEQFSVFWRIHSEESTSGPLELRLDDWLQLWQERDDGDENRPLQDVVVWKHLPHEERTLFSHLPSDYAIHDRAEENPAHGAASDGRDVGFRADLLPELVDPP